MRLDVERDLEVPEFVEPPVEVEVESEIEWLVLLKVPVDVELLVPLDVDSVMEVLRDDPLEVVRLVLVPLATEVEELVLEDSELVWLLDAL